MKNFLVSLACCLALGAALLVPTAGATWPGSNGSIAFSRTNGAGAQSKADIWIATASGAQRRLTATPRIDELEPTFSPGGRTIAYVRRAHGNADVWLMRSDGREKRPLVAGERDELQPSFFPSGRSLLFTVFDGERGWSVYSVRLDGGGTKRQVANATFPVVSPRGGLLAYSADGNGGGIRLLNLRTERVRVLTTGSAQGLDFSPSGRRLLFVGQRDCRRGGSLRFALLSIGLQDRRPRFLRRNCGGGFAGGAWSPSGTRIVYTQKLQRGRRLGFRLRTMTATGVPAYGAPRHLAGTQELFPAWQPLR